MERTGIQVASRDDASPASVVEFAQRAEALGFETCWVGESWGREAFGVLTMIGCGTSRIQLGTGIVNVFSRSPGLMAQSIATLDEISGGRAILGLGSSGVNVIEHWQGLTYERPIQRIREYIEIVRMILRGERLNYDGKLFHMARGFRLPFKPLRADVPIYLATLAGRSLRQTGELADGWLPIYFCPEKFNDLTAPMREGAVAAGRDFKAITISPYILTAVSHDGEDARALMRAHVAFYIGGMGVYYHKLISGYGFAEEADAVRAAGRDSAVARGVTDAMLNAFTISGTAGACRERLAAYRAAGVQAPVLSMPHGAPEAMVRETIEALAPARQPVA